ncbi:MAG TPA: SRPBCC domain-containing protein [Devosia sp.]
MSETRTVIVEREIGQPAEKIWRALTQPHLIEEWLMKSDFKPVVGQRFTLSKQPKPDINVVIDCKVLEVEPERTLSYTWAAYGTETVVTFTLTPTPTGTVVRVEQAGFPAENKAAWKGANASWPHFLAALDELLKRTH